MVVFTTYFSNIGFYVLSGSNDFVLRSMNNSILLLKKMNPHKSREIIQKLRIHNKLVNHAFDEF